MPQAITGRARALRARVEDKRAELPPTRHLQLVRKQAPRVEAGGRGTSPSRTAPRPPALTRPGPILA
jgi:hypothetical protein